ncbi:MAG: MFS transporter, partial [Sandaracinaceae bacterium]|nr:MFS transporter [Sandaracinaceae bacterium]
MSAVRNYILVTLAYWAFTLTDGALRMLVLLHFHGLGYSPVDLAFLFLFYEFFGVVTNLLGGYIAARLGLRVTLFSGLALQVLALGMLSLLAPGWTKVASVAYVMGAQALSGIAKDLTKMSSKSSIKVLVPEDQSSSLFKWVAVLTGSKNALKGAGFFLGGLLLSWLGFRESLWAMAGALLLVLVGGVAVAPARPGQGQGQEQVPAILSRRAGHQRAVGGALLPVRRARHLVRGRGPGVPSRCSSSGASAVGAFPGALGDRLARFSPPRPRSSAAGHAARAPRPEGHVRARVAAGRASVAYGARHPREHVTHRRAGGGSRRVRGHLRRQFVGALVPHPGVLGRGQGGHERGLLLHGQRGWPAGGHALSRRALPARGAAGLPLGNGRVRRHHGRHLAAAPARQP